MHFACSYHSFNPHNEIRGGRNPYDSHATDGENDTGLMLVQNPETKQKL